MLNNIRLLYSRLTCADLTNMQSIPIWRAKDTPLRSLYRVYEALVAREHYAVGPEVEYFWYQARRPWELHCIPDPCDRDPGRYAILACIAGELAEAFNWRLSLGMRREKSKHIYPEMYGDVPPPFTPVVAPAWTKGVPAIDAELTADLPGDFLDSSGKLVLEADGGSLAFAKRNIIACKRAGRTCQVNRSVSLTNNDDCWLDDGKLLGIAVNQGHRVLEAHGNSLVSTIHWQPG